MASIALLARAESDLRRGLGMMKHGPRCFWTVTGLIVLAIEGTAETNPLGSLRTLYAVNQAASSRGSIAVYDINSGHRLLKTIQTVPEVHNVKGVAASAVTGKLYVAYYDRAGVGMIYCLDLAKDTVLWNRKIDLGVDRLAVHPDGQLLYVPTGEDNTADHINVVDANTGDIVRKVYFSKRSHDTQYPLSGPLFQETKAEDGSGNYLYQIDPKSYAVSRVGPYSGILGPYAVDNASRYVVNNVTGLWGMQVADLKTGRIATAELAEHPGGSPGLMHGIGWTPDEREVWQSGTWRDPHVYLWDMHDPMAPVLKQTLTLRSGRGSHWLTFTINGDYAYIAPNKNSDDGTEIFDVQTHDSVGVIGSTEDMLEIDFQDARVKRVGDQYGIGRRNDLIR
jgi:6-phosphogluconolactonase (cycloisomerase 2 family)